MASIDSRLSRLERELGDRRGQAGPPDGDPAEASAAELEAREAELEARRQAWAQWIEWAEANGTAAERAGLKWLYEYMAEGGDVDALDWHDPRLAAAAALEYRMPDGLAMTGLDELRPARIAERLIVRDERQLRALWSALPTDQIPGMQAHFDESWQLYHRTQEIERARAYWRRYGQVNPLCLHGDPPDVPVCRREPEGSEAT